jgi:outer membrane lipoprotein SlyB
MKRITTISLAIALTGCAATGDNLKSNVYKEGQVNQVQSAKTITILAVLPAQIEVDNSEQKKNAQIAGGVLGALAGGLGAGFGTKGNPWATAGATAGGGAIGAAAGSMVKDKALVEGVSLTFTDESGKTLNSAQVGRQCEFRAGKAIMISATATETRIQPNNPAGCPVEKK